MTMAKACIFPEAVALGRVAQTPFAANGDEVAVGDRADAAIDDLINTATDPRTEEIANAVATITTAIDALDADPGAALTEEAIDAWSLVYGASMAEYERLRAKAKKAGARVAEIDRAIGARSKYAKEKAGKEKTLSQKPSSTYRTSNTDTGDSEDQRRTDRFPSSTSSTDPLSFAPDALVQWTERGPRLLIASDAALEVAKVLRGRFAYCTQAELWHAFGHVHWEPLIQSAPLHEALTRWLYPATGEMGFTPRYQDAIMTLIQRANLLPVPLTRAGAIPFQNGLLDLATRRLIPITPDNALSWFLPYAYRPDADCPRVKSWLLQAVGMDAETVELLRAFLSALIRGGADLQRFLHLIGPGGSGKSTFFRLATALIGERNTVSTDLKELEQNRFESATLYGKRLAIIADSDKYGGSINKLKAVTGQDPIRLERKHVQQAGTFVFEGLVFMASNEPLVTTDYTSGLERRRVTVAFDYRVSETEKTAWRNLGGEEAVLHAELPGVVNWVLEMPIDDMAERISHPPQRTIAANLDAMRAGNPASDWLTECGVPEPGAWIQVGDKKERREPETGAVYYLDADSKLYPNYLDWCRRNGRESLSLRRFRSVTVDMLRTLGHDVLETRRSAGQGIQGLRLRQSNEAPFAWDTSRQSSTSSTQHAASAGLADTQPIEFAESAASAGCSRAIPPMSSHAPEGTDADQWEAF